MQAKSYRNNAHEFIAATAASAVIASLHWAKYSGSAPVFRAAILDKSGRRRSGFDQDAAARQTSAADALITHIDRGIRYFDPLNVKAMAIPHTTDPFSLFFFADRASTDPCRKTHDSTTAEPSTSGLILTGKPEFGGGIPQPSPQIVCKASTQNQLKGRIIHPSQHNLGLRKRRGDHLANWKVLQPNIVGSRLHQNLGCTVTLNQQYRLATAHIHQGNLRAARVA